jgi:hypothetical protein
MGKRSTALFVLSGLFALVPMKLSGQGIQPVQAQLVQRLDAGKASVGDSILAKVQSAWKNDSCELRAGAIIQGHVVSQKAHSKTEKVSEMAILFDTGQCNGREMSFWNQRRMLRYDFSIPNSMCGQHGQHLRE